MQPVDARSDAQLARHLSGALGGQHREHRIIAEACREPATTCEQQTVLGTSTGQEVIVATAIVGDLDFVAGGAQPAADALQHLVAQQTKLAPVTLEAPQV